MTSLLINSEHSLQSSIGDLREMYAKHKFLKLNVRAGKDRSLDQNAISHAWYEQIARELREDDVIGWKSFCKLHFGVPIMRIDTEFKAVYDASIKLLSYEQKLIAMRSWPVTSLMTKEQLSKYLEAMQQHFAGQGVQLEFPEAA